MDLLVGVKTQIKADPALANSCSDERAIARAEGQADVKTASRQAAVAPRASR